MLLEQQNKKRLMMARQQHDVAARSAKENGAAADAAKEIASATPVEQTPQATEQSVAVQRSIQLMHSQIAQMQKYRAEHLLRTREALSRAQAAAVSPAAVHVENVAAPNVEDSASANVEEAASADVGNAASPDVESVVAPVANVMVFPTLEKESPTSSTYQDATSARSTTTIGQVQPEAKVEVASEIETETETVATSEPAEERFEDLESVRYEDSDVDDGFMTDEEYDILDASDEEVLNHGKTA